MYKQKLTVVGLLFFLSLFASAAHGQLLGIIAEFCEDVEVLTEEAIDELDASNRDLDECLREYGRCLDRADNGLEVVDCIGDVRRCTERANEAGQEACKEFLREFRNAYRDASREADREDIEDEFQNSSIVQEKVDDAGLFAGVCSASQE